MPIFEQISQYRLVPVITIESPEAAVPLADALIRGGLPVAEITFRTEAAAAVIKKLAAERPELILGAGTVLSITNVRAALDAGAKFGVAPGLNPTIVQAAKEMNWPFVPGVCTPTDVETAISLGCKTLKFFPAEAMGGLNMLKSLIAPYGHTGVQFMPTGGVKASNLAEYLSTPGVVACGGTWIASKDDIAEGRWDVIEDRCRIVAEIVAQLG